MSPFEHIAEQMQDKMKELQSLKNLFKDPVHEVMKGLKDVAEKIEDIGEELLKFQKVNFAFLKPKIDRIMVA